MSPSNGSRSQNKARKYFLKYENIQHPYNMIKFLTIGVQSKITCHANKQENMTHNEEQKQSTETCLEIIKMIELKMTKRALTFLSA